MTATLGKFKKDPQAVLDYTVDWSAWLSPAGDTITDATATASPAGLSVDSTTTTTDEVTVWLSGGTAGSSYMVTVHITTAGGRQDDRTMQIDCKDM
ncbi:phage fiber-tail adaptor protein [Mycobacteroides abscessus]